MSYECPTTPRNKSHFFLRRGSISAALSVRSGSSPARLGQATIWLLETHAYRPVVFLRGGTEAHVPNSGRKSVIDPNLQTVFGFFNAQLRPTDFLHKQGLWDGPTVFWVLVQEDNWKKSNRFADVITKVALFPRYFLVDGPAVIWTCACHPRQRSPTRRKYRKIIISCFNNVIAGYLTSNIFFL